VNIFLFALLIARVFLDGYYNFKLFGLPVSGYLSTLIILVFANFIFTSKIRPPAPFALAILAIVASSFYGFIGFGLEPVFEGVRFISVICVFYLALASKTTIRIQTLTLAISLISSVNIGFQTLQQSNGEGLFVGNFWRFPGLFAHPNTAALFYGMNFILASYQLITREGLKPLPALGSLVLSLSGLALTLSIGGIVFTLVGVTSLLVTMNIPTRRKFASVMLVFSGLGVSALVFPNAIQRLATFTSSEAYVYSDQTNSLVWRLNQWQQYLEVFFAHPVFGLGFGSSTSGQLVPNGLLPHNEYLRFLVEAGFVGLVCGLLFLGRLTWKLFLASRQKMNWAAKCTFALLLGLMVNAITENTFIYSVPMFIVAILVASSYRIFADQTPDQIRGVSMSVLPETKFRL